MAGSGSFTAKTISQSASSCALGGVDNCLRVGDPGGEPDESQEVFRLLFVTDGDTSEAFNSSEEAFDDVAIPVTNAVVTIFGLSSWVRSDAGFRLGLAYLLTDRIAVVSGVGQHVLRAKSVEQHRSLRSVTLLARREQQPHRPPLPIDRRMHLGGQASARTAEATPVVCLLFFSAARRREPAAD